MEGDTGILAYTPHKLDFSCAAQLLIKLNDDFSFKWAAEGTAEVLGYSKTDDLAIMMAVLCFCFLVLALVAVTKTTKSTFRGRIRMRCRTTMAP
eukprot:4833669-Prymnesium_polylepis.2